MSSGLQERLSDVMLTVRTRPLFALRLNVRPIVDFGQTPTTHRRVGVVFGGEFEGERLAGAVLDGGCDWQSVRTDSSTLLDVRLNLKTTGGALITMSYKGLRHGPADVIARLERGEAVASDSYYFRISAMFETASEEFFWLNRILAIGVGHRFEDGPVYNLFELL